MPKERDLLKMMWTNFRRSLTPNTMKKTLVGKDVSGNEYYEIKKGDSPHKRSQRWFQAKVGDSKETQSNIDGFDNDIPAEWESWLRGRRNKPPTEEELAKSAALRELSRQGAVEKGYLLERKEEKLQSFPTHEDYESMPGTSFDKYKEK